MIKFFIFFFFIGLTTAIYYPSRSGYSYSSKGYPSSSYYPKSKLSFPQWCKEYGCKADYYGSDPLYEQKKDNCFCDCPAPVAEEVLYPVVLDYNLVKADAKLGHNDSVSNMKEYCPHVKFIGNKFIIQAWTTSRTEMTATQPIFTFMPYSKANLVATSIYGAPISVPGVTLTRIMIDPRKKFSVLMICLPDGTKYWVVHAPNTYRLSYKTEQVIFNFLNLIGLDTSQPYRPDFSYCSFT